MFRKKINILGVNLQTIVLCDLRLFGRPANQIFYWIEQLLSQKMVFFPC